MSETMDAMQAINPNVHEQMDAWQIERTQQNLDAYDWGAFREHAMALGAPDPGEQEPEEFRQYDWTKYRTDQ